MTKYAIIYIDKEGDKQDFIVDAFSYKDAINNVFYFCQDARRVVLCTPKPMFIEWLPAN